MLTWIMIAATAMLIGIDQITKIWALSDLSSGRVISVIEGVFQFEFAKNTGVAFSMLEGKRWIFIPITLVISAVLVSMMLRSPLRRYRLFNITCVLILSGAIGNLIDRMVYGYVVDFLHATFIDFPIFNFADCCVVVGAILLFVFALFVMKEDDDTPLRTLFFGIEKKSKEKKDG